MTEAKQRHLQHARRYLATLERGATGDTLAAFFTADVVQEDFPNRLVPTGARRDLAALLDGAVRGQKVMQAQRLEVLNALASGNQVAVELQWTGTVAVPLGSLPVGGRCAPASPSSSSTATERSPASTTTTASTPGDRFNHR